MLYTRKKGSVLVFSLIVLAIVLSSALSITMVNVSNRKSAASTAQSVQSFQSADTATEQVLKAIYNGNYASLSGLYAVLSPDGATCPNPLTVSVSGGTARISFFNTNGAALTTGDCASALWRDTLARVKVEGLGGTGGGPVRVIEVAIAPLSSMAWGENGDGRLGDGTTIDRHAPVSTIGGSKWKSVSAGGSTVASGGHVLAVRIDGTLWAWGNGANYRLGNNDTSDVSSPVQIGTDNTWESVSAGASHSLGIKTDHTLWAWGEGSHYRLGNDSRNDVHTPVQIGTDGNCSPSPCPAGWKSVSAGFIDHSLAIGTDNTLWAWGKGDRYKLGTDSTNDEHIPKQIGTGNNCNSASCPAGWKSVSAGDLYSIAIGSDDKLYVWGSATNYQLGNNDNNNDVHTPTLIPPPTPASATWLSVSAGENHVLGIRSDGTNSDGAGNGTLWSWGSNAEGQLGTGSTGGADQQVPRLVGIAMDNHWKFVSAGDRHSLAIKVNGTNNELWTWGNDNHGQVGDGSASNAGTPYQILGNWQTTVDGGKEFSIGVRK